MSKFRHQHIVTNIYVAVYFNCALFQFRFHMQAGIDGISGPGTNWSGLVCQFEFFFGPGPILVRVDCRRSGIDLF